MTHGSDFTFDVIKVFKEEREGQNGSVIQLIKWQRSGYPVLEKRKIYFTKDGDIRFRKTTGFTLEDIRFINENVVEIMALMKTE